MKNIYFLSDVHLDSLAIGHRRTHGHRLVRFLDSIKHKVAAVYLLGDMFGFWNEYKYVIPKSFTRFLSKTSELADTGVEVRFFTSNHDLWAYSYLEKECGVILHRKPITAEIYDRMFYLAHGDRLGDPDPMFRFLRKVFHNHFYQRLLSFFHPWWGMQLGLNWAKKGRSKRKDGEGVPYLGEDKEYLVQRTKECMLTHRDIDHYIYGHRHTELDLTLSRKARLLILGDQVWWSIYAVFGGGHVFLEEHVGGKSKS